LDAAIGTSQAVDLGNEQIARSIRQYDGKEECVAVDLCAAVLWHNVL
jgi:hypothetical protein